MYNEFVQYMLPTLATILGAILTALCGYFISYINKKKIEVEATTDNETAKKYMNMIADTITNCVKETNQTYVESLKKENAFTKDAQEKAFKMTFDNVMNLLTTDAINYLNEITNDVTQYLKSAIESEVNEEKIY